MKKILSALVVSGLLLSGCGSTSTTDPPGTSSRAAVPWEDYAGGLKSRIDGLADSKDCGALQREFDNADANSAATATRTDHDNVRLMQYIDEAIRLAGCY